MKVSPIYTKLANEEIENAKQTPRKLGLHVNKKNMYRRHPQATDVLMYKILNQKTISGWIISTTTLMMI